jgi:hypothetical protein
MVFSGCVVDASIMTRYRKQSSVIFNPDKTAGVLDDLAGFLCPAGFCVSGLCLSARLTSAFHFYVAVKRSVLPIFSDVRELARDLFGRHSVIYPAFYGFHSKTSAVCNFSSCKHFSKKIYSLMRPFVVRLLYAAGPLAINRLVVAEHIDPIQ